MADPADAPPGGHTDVEVGGVRLDGPEGREAPAALGAPQPARVPEAAWKEDAPAGVDADVLRIGAGERRAADQGPDALRRYVQRWDKQIASLKFSDYVDAKTAQSWEAKTELTRQRNTEGDMKLASSEPR